MKIGVGSVVFKVKDVLIEIDVESLVHILHIPIDGSRSDDLTKCKTCLKVILECEDAEGIKEVSAKQLSMKMRLLHHLIG